MKLGKLKKISSKLKEYFFWSRDYIIAGVLGLVTFILLAVFFTGLLFLAGVVVTWLALSFAWLLIVANKMVPPNKKEKE